MARASDEQDPFIIYESSRRECEYRECAASRDAANPVGGVVVAIGASPAPGGGAGVIG